MVEMMPSVSLVEALMSSSKYTILAVVITCLTSSYIVFTIFYRLFFSPLSHFPGPRIAGKHKPSNDDILCLTIGRSTSGVIDSSLLP